ncbi:MAG: DUF5067 domain-containing protein [Oscillospiraceae bacterium]|nr:DUF5067 domain-containing protein [Oscillospiraceae bacterium]
MSDNRSFNDNRKDNNSWWKILLAVIVVLLILGTIIAFAMRNRDKDEAIRDTTTTTTTTTTTNTNPNDENIDDDIDPNDDVNEIDTRGTLGAHTVDIKSHRIVKDENGKDAILITYEVENGSSGVMNFLTVLSDTAYQGDKRLEAAVLKDIEGFNPNSITQDIEPNGKHDVTRAFLLADLTTDVKMAIKQLATTDNRVVTRTFEID